MVIGITNIKKMTWVQVKKKKSTNNPLKFGTLNDQNKIGLNLLDKAKEVRLSFVRISQFSFATMLVPSSLSSSWMLKVQLDSHQWPSYAASVRPLSRYGGHTNISHSNLGSRRTL